jgi:hypothetical protein
MVNPMHGVQKVRGCSTSLRPASPVARLTLRGAPRISIPVFGFCELRPTNWLQARTWSSIKHALIRHLPTEPRTISPASLEMWIVVTAGIPSRTTIES